jgi:hypothetical protein
MGGIMRALVAVWCGALFALLLGAAPGWAQAFISATGNNANPCTRTAPCRTLQRGINATNPGRELQILDAGEYGIATITKSITISAVGVSATVRSLAAASNAITIANAGARVVLRGLFLTGGGTGTHGIRINDAAAVYIVDCEIERFHENGVWLDQSNTELFVLDTISRDNDQNGLRVDAFGTTTKVTVDASRFDNNGQDGIIVNDAESSVTRSVMSGNLSDGIQQGGGRMNVTESAAVQNLQNGYFASGSSSRMTVESSLARGNVNAGLLVQPGSLARISNSVFIDSATGIHNGLGAVETRGNNTVAGNTTNVANPGGLAPIAGE